MKALHRLLAALVLTPAVFAAVPVEVASKPAGPWKTQATRTLDDLPADAVAKLDAELDTYGGRRDRGGKATGFFYVEQSNGRWWLIDPAGGRFIHKAVVSVAPLRPAGAQAVYWEKFGSDEGWATQTMALLREHGCNGTGSWTDTAKLRATPQPYWHRMPRYWPTRTIGLFARPLATCAARWPAWTCLRAACSP
jgi:hypothetical protein